MRTALIYSYYHYFNGGVLYLQGIPFLYFIKKIMASPIWKDYYVRLGTNDSCEFRILCQGKVIYQGKAWKRPGQSILDVRINDICADYINTIPHDNTERIVFSVEIPFEGDWENIDEVSFENDWSYEYDYNPATMGVSNPINGKIDRNQWIVFTAYHALTIAVRINYKDGRSQEVFVPTDMDAAFDRNLNAAFADAIRKTYTGTAVFNLSAWDNVESVTIGNKVFNVVNNCNRYALFYVNAYGGWDSLLIEGNHSVTDNLVRHTREIECDNRVLCRSTENYVNEISKTMTLHTSWLSDEESSKMHHLLNSTNVFLGDIVTGQMIPVILTNTTTEYKTYKGNGGRLVNYTINVTIAQERRRR